MRINENTEKPFAMRNIVNGFVYVATSGRLRGRLDYLTGHHCVETLEGVMSATDTSSS